MKNNFISLKVFITGLIFCLLITSLFFGCSEQTSNNQQTSSSAQSKYGGILKMAEVTDGIGIGSAWSMVRGFCMEEVLPAVEPLFRFDSAGVPEPYLVKEYKLDVAAKTITMSLRQGIKFHDGTDFNAQAVKWNLDKCVAAKMSGTGYFKSTDIVDDYTIRLNLSVWDSTILSTLATYPGFIISPTAWQKGGTTDKERDAWVADHPVGTGPFTFVSWQKEVKVVYKKFDGYWQKGKPYLDGIEYYLIADSVSRQMSLKTGEMDMIGTVLVSDLPDLQKAGLTIVKCKAGAGNWNLVPDSANPKSPWSNLKVRQAAQYAIDCETLNKGVALGQFVCSNQLVDPSNWGYNSSIVGYPYNPAKAKQLLAEAGYPNGFDTTIISRTGEMELLFQAIVNQLKKVGINGEHQIQLSGAWDQKTLRGGGWEGLIMGTAYTAPDLLQIMRDRYGASDSFFVSMKKPDDYLKAINDALAAPDFETKKKLVQAASKIMVDTNCQQLYSIKVYYCAAINPKVRDSNYYARPLYTDWTPWDTWIEKK